MSEISITNRTLGALQPQAQPYFLRDNTLKGFGVKVNPSGKITFIVEVKHRGAAKRGKPLELILSFRGAEARPEALEASISFVLDVSR